MRDGTVAGQLPDLLEEVALAEPARRRLGVRRDDQLVDLLERERVLDRAERAALEDVAQRGNALLAQPRDRPVEAAAGRRPARVLVDDAGGAWLTDRARSRPP